MAKFYTYHQNNSGGTFVVDKEVTQIVIIEAESAALADEKAESIGIYFNGVESDWDCRCCGDRWNTANEFDAADTPLIYGTPVEKYRSLFIEEGMPFCYVYYLNGKKQSWAKETGGEISHLGSEDG